MPRRTFPEISDGPIRRALEDLSNHIFPRDEQIVQVEFPAANTEVAVEITGFTEVPDEATPLIPDGNTVFYRGGSEWTPKRIYIKSSVAGVTNKFRVCRFAEDI